MSVFVMSGKYKCFGQELKNIGHKIIFTNEVKNFDVPEQYHADMQVLPIENRIFMLKECAALAENIEEICGKKVDFCSKKAQNRYPDNILLNFLYFGGKLYGKLSAIEPELLEYCTKNCIEIVNINQGYARCSTLIIDENAAVTADEGIKNALEKNGAEVLKIFPGNIELDGYDCGFIGGTGGLIDKKTLAFFGNIKIHPNYGIIKEFCFKHGVNIKILCKNMPLTDIGGIVKIC